MKSYKNLLLIVSSFLFFSILIIFIFNFISKKSPNTNTNFEEYILGSGDNKMFERKKVDPNLENKEVTIEPYGCFSNVKNMFFQERVNPYSRTGGEIITSFYISEGSNKGIVDLIKNVIKNGYIRFGNKMMKKYNKSGPRSITLLEVAKLGKLSGYHYISVLKNPEGSTQYAKVYLTYTPPTTSSSLYKYTSNFTDEDFNSILADSDLPEFTLTPKLNNYTNENEPIEGKEISCGFPCITENKPETFTDSNGVVRQYMCGSVNYPTIKTPERYAIYKIN